MTRDSERFALGLQALNKLKIKWSRMFRPFKKNKNGCNFFFFYCFFVNA